MVIPDLDFAASDDLESTPFLSVSTDKGYFKDAGVSECRTSLAVGGFCPVTCPSLPKLLFVRRGRFDRCF